MPEYVFKFKLPAPIPQDVLKVELDKFIREMLRKYGVYEVNVEVKSTNPDAQVEVATGSDGEELEASEEGLI
jgi:hypothetical protein